jgi:hypothetical protein
VKKVLFAALFFVASSYSSEFRGSFAEFDALTDDARAGIKHLVIRGGISPQYQQGMWDKVCSMTNLQKLNLSRNQLSGSIPAELGNLTNLKKLWLFSNRLSGSIPAALGNLTNLQVLSLSKNQLSGSIPAELWNLRDLQKLSLSANSGLNLSSFNFYDCLRIRNFDLLTDSCNLVQEKSTFDDETNTVTVNLAELYSWQAKLNDACFEEGKKSTIRDVLLRSVTPGRTVRLLANGASMIYSKDFKDSWKWSVDVTDEKPEAAGIFMHMLSSVNVFGKR